MHLIVFLFTIVISVQSENPKFCAMPEVVPTFDHNIRFRTNGIRCSFVGDSFVGIEIQGIELARSRDCMYKEDIETLRN